MAGSLHETATTFTQRPKVVSEFDLPWNFYRVHPHGLPDRRYSLVSPVRPRRFALEMGKLDSVNLKPVWTDNGQISAKYGFARFFLEQLPNQHDQPMKTTGYPILWEVQEDVLETGQIDLAVRMWVVDNSQTLQHLLPVFRVVQYQLSQSQPDKSGQKEIIGNRGNLLAEVTHLHTSANISNNFWRSALNFRSWLRVQGCVNYEELPPRINVLDYTGELLKRFGNLDFSNPPLLAKFAVPSQ